MLCCKVHQQHHFHYLTRGARMSNLAYQATVAAYSMYLMVQSSFQFRLLVRLGRFEGKVRQDRLIRRWYFEHSCYHNTISLPYIITLRLQASVRRLLVDCCVLIVIPLHSAV